jgi:two-component system nitrogen regulation response regulator GlnG
MLPWGKRAVNVKRAEDLAKECCEIMGLSQKVMGKTAKIWVGRRNWDEDPSEMRRAVYYAVLSAQGDTVEAVHFPPRNARDVEAYADKKFDRVALETIAAQKIGHFFERLGKVEAKGVYRTVIRQVERPLVDICLKWADGNRLKAARVLGLNRNTLRKKMKELGIQ